jgi:hypothetical protein
MTITGSPDITSLQIKTVFDISGNAPKISLENESAGPGLANISWWFVAKSPSNSLIHDGEESSPDVTGAWTEFLLSDAWPSPFNQIEWSGAPYTLSIYAKDSDGNIYRLDQSAAICRPSGNGPTSKTKFGEATVNVQVKCTEGRIFFQDTTNASYRGITGEQLQSTLKMNYPFDDTGTVPDPFQISHFSTALVPITYSGEGYQFITQSIYQYDLGNNVFLKIKYIAKGSFPVLCNIDLGSLACAVTGLVDDLERGNCKDVNEANRKLSLINPKFSLAIMGVIQPLTGIDVYKLVKDIETIGGFSCDCCNAPTGIIPTQSSTLDGYNFSIVSQGGDINGSVQVTGTNVQFLLNDKSYIFKMGGSPADFSAFTIVPSTSGYVKTYELNIDGPVLAEEILDIIKSDIGLVNLFNSIVNANGNGVNALIVDGGCIFDSTSTCDFIFTLTTIPTTGTFAIFSGIRIGQITTPYSFAFNLTNLAAFQTYLNSLGLGTFVVTNPSGQTVLISTTANGNDLQGLNYKKSGITYPAGYTKNCTGYIPIDANQVVRNIINYICGIDDSQVYTSKEYTVSYRDALNVLQNIIVPEGSPLQVLIDAIIFSNNKNSTNSAAVSVSCQTIKDSFGTQLQVIGGNDVLFGTSGDGACTQIKFLDAFLFMLTTGQNVPAIRDKFCEFVVLCGAGQPCAPYEYLEVLVTDYDTACTPIIGIEFSPS